MEHGGDLLSYESQYEGDLIDFSSNINPLGPPRGLDDFLYKNYESLFAYPDIKYRKLTESIGEYLGCGKDNIIVGNGAMELIDNFIFLAERVLIFLPSFLEYEKRAKVHGKEIIYLDYDDDFKPVLKKLERIIKPGDLLILGNPNNPTGLRIEKDLLESIYDLTKASGAFLVLDEAFFEFCPIDYDSIGIFKDKAYENLGIIRAATKFFALPGLRLGYGCTSIEIAEKIKQIQPPWSVNAYAEIGGAYIFKDKDYIKNSKAYIGNERTFLFERLSKLKKIRPFPSQTNFLLIKLLDKDEDYVFDFFLKRGIIIRKCSSFKGLDDSFIRIAVKSRIDNSKLIDIFLELEKEI